MLQHRVYKHMQIGWLAAASWHSCTACHIKATQQHCCRQVKPVVAAGQTMCSLAHRCILVQLHHLTHGEAGAAALVRHLHKIAQIHLQSKGAARWLESAVFTSGVASAALTLRLCKLAQPQCSCTRVGSTHTDEQ